MTSFALKMKTVERYTVLNFEVARFSSFRDVPKNHFVTADIDDSIKRKRIRVSPKKGQSQSQLAMVVGEQQFVLRPPHYAVM